VSRISLINEEVVTIVILFTILVMIIGNLLTEKVKKPEAQKTVVSEIVDYTDI